MFARTLTTYAVAGAVALGAMTGVAAAKELSLSYFMGPKHPMNKAVFTPFAKKLAEVSGGKLTVKQFAGGALNSAPPKQYSILLKGVADIAFAIPGYTGQLFPITETISHPGVASNSVDGTTKLWNAMSLIEKEYKAKILAMWANHPPILITKNKAVRSFADLKGLKVRVPTAASVPYVEAMGASAVSQPVSVINQNLQNGTIDAIFIGSSAMRSFKLYEPGKYLTVGMPGSGSAFVLLMNQKVYNGLSAQEKKWVDEASGQWLSKQGGAMYDKAAAGGMKLAKEKGLEIINLSDGERAKFQKAIEAELTKFKARKISGDLTGGDVIKAMNGM